MCVYIGNVYDLQPISTVCYKNELLDNRKILTGKQLKPM